MTERKYVQQCKALLRQRLCFSLDPSGLGEDCGISVNVYFGVRNYLKKCHLPLSMQCRILPFNVIERLHEFCLWSGPAVSVKFAITINYTYIQASSVAVGIISYNLMPQRNLVSKSTLYLVPYIHKVQTWCGYLRDQASREILAARAAIVLRSSRGEQWSQLGI